MIRPKGVVFQETHDRGLSFLRGLTVKDGTDPMTHSTDPTMTSEYHYRCTDQSLLLPLFKRYYVAFFFRFVPRGLTANFITLISSGCIFSLMVIDSAGVRLSQAQWAGLIAFMLHAYLVGDHLDGMQAKQTRTSSPLGEFLDHYLDVYNGAIVFYILLSFLGPIPAVWFYTLLYLNCLAFAATMMVELEHQALFFGFLGTLEGLLLLIVFFVSWLMPPVRDFWQLRLPGDIALYWIVIVGMGLGYVGTLIDLFKRLRYCPRPFFFYGVISLVLVTALGYHDPEAWWGWLLVVLYSGEYIGKVMASYLLHRRHRYPDLIASVGIVWLAVCIGLLPSWVGPVFYGLTVYLGLRVIVVFARTVFQLRGYWYWVNP
jgi:phosphatidylglycerophosphate synthase